jgi:hypothetical protein
MPHQSLLRLIKRWKRYELRENWIAVPRQTRGVYVLYKKGVGESYNVVYIGVAGISPSGKGGTRWRLKMHDARKSDWTHFSLFEVHDNITRDEIREIEALLLGIFRHDPRIQLLNKQKGSKKLYQLRRLSQWKSDN